MCCHFCFLLKLYSTKFLAHDDIDNKSDNVANWKPSCCMSTTSSATRETCMVFSLMLIMLVVTFCMQSTGPFLCNGSPSCFIKLMFLNSFCVCYNVQPLYIADLLMHYLRHVSWWIFCVWLGCLWPRLHRRCCCWHLCRQSRYQICTVACTSRCGNAISLP